MPVGSGGRMSGQCCGSGTSRCRFGRTVRVLVRGAHTNLGAGWSEDARLLTSTARRSFTHMAMHRTGLLSTVDVGYLAGTRPFFAKWIGEATREDQTGPITCSPGSISTSTKRSIV